MTYPVIDFEAYAAALGVDLPAAFSRLQALYADVDARNRLNTKDLDLPCHRGCDMCCHESVFLTPLEFFYAWAWAQQNLDAPTRTAMITAGLYIYKQYQSIIDGFLQAPPEGAADHLGTAKLLRFRCPMLSNTGECRIYPARELFARLFGCSFYDAESVYGCGLVSAHLAGKVVKLLPARPTARRMHDLPLTHMRQVYPYYFHLFFSHDAR